MVEGVRKELIAAAMDACGEALEWLGFQRRREGIYTRALTDEISGWVGLPRNAKWYPLKVTATVGVRHHAVEMLVGDGKKADRYGPAATVAQNIGYVMPEQRYLEWLFWEEPQGDDVSEFLAYLEENALSGGVRYRANALETAADLAAAVRAYGAPYMKRLTDPNVLLHEIKERKPLGDAPHTLPALLFVLGRVDEARAELTDELAAREADSHPGLEEYRYFAARLLARIQQ